MFKIKNKTRKTIVLLKLLTDIVIIYISFAVGYALKFKLYLLGITDYFVKNVSLKAYFNVLHYVILLWLFAFILNGMYKLYSGPLGKMFEAMSVVKGVLFGAFEVMAFTFLYKSFPGSRYVLVYASTTAIILMICSRVLIGWFSGFIHKKGIGNIRSVIVGNSVLAQRIAEKIHQYPEYGFNYIGFITENKPKTVIHPLKAIYKELGKMKDLEKLIQKYRIEAIFMVEKTMPIEQIYEIAEMCLRNNIYFRFMPSKYQTKEYKVSFDVLDSLPLLKIDKIQFSPFNRLLKRIFDLLIVIPLILVCSPIMIIIALLIKLTSEGEIIYKQKRVTMHGREFDFLKFRSMRVDAEKGKPVLATKDQKNRTTRIGNFLRKTSLDEIPQLFNVLFGDMSLVGPRPERPFFHEKYKKIIPNWEDRLLVRGGITGWAQINGRAQLSASPEEKLEYDLYYIANWSLLFDIKVLLNTFILVLKQKDVY